MNEQLEPCPVCLSKEDPDYWQKHLDLARHAEIGRLVEQIAGIYPIKANVNDHTDYLTDENALDVLREIADKLGIKEKR